MRSCRSPFCITFALNDAHVVAIHLPTKHSPRRKAGFFSAQNPVLTASPAFHQNLSRSPPEPCTGVHKKGCDLEGVEGQHPLPNIHSLLK